VAGATDEKALLDRLRRGERAAFDELVRANGGRLLAVTRRILRSEEDARDAVQEAFLKAFEKLGEFQGESRISTWLHRIAVNAALMKLRSRRRRPEEPIDDLLPRFQADGHHAGGPGVVPPWRIEMETELDRKRTLETVVACVDRLPESYRTVILLRDVEGLSTEEAADALGIRPDALKMRLHRARLALRTLLDARLRRGA
jgi:RNA polymerase sigma-70 factor (ECF subfamily)